MNKYPAPAPQQNSDYEDDDGPGLGTLGAALAAGALLTPIGRPVRALAKKGLGAADEALGGYGKAGVGKLREAGAAARKAMLGEDDFFRKVGNDYREAEALKLAAAKKLNPDFSAESFSDPAAYMHNLGMTLQGPKSFFGKMFKQDGVGPSLNPDPLKDAAVSSAVTDALAANAKRASSKPNLASKQPPTAEAAVDLLGGFRPVPEAQRTGIVKMLAEAQKKADAEYAKNMANRLGNKPSDKYPLFPDVTPEEALASAAAAAEAKARARAANPKKPRTPKQRAADSNK
jgi:hypothetical protein